MIAIILLCVLLLLLLVAVYAMGVSHGFDAYEQADARNRGQHWIEPGAAFDYVEPFRGEPQKEKEDAA